MMEPRAPGENLLDADEVMQHGDEVIWRYMSLAKFISLLDSSCLYFTRLDRMPDRHEGAISKPALERAIESDWNQSSLEGSSTSETRSREFTYLSEAVTSKLAKAHVLVNCWHRSAAENASMWAIYGGDGVAIKSTIRQLRECTRHRRNPVVMVQFVYYADHMVQDMDPYEAFLFKHPLFAYEQEIRALMLFDPEEDAPPSSLVNVDVRALVDSVHLAPGSGKLLRSVVASLLVRYGFPDIPVVSSVADSSPEYREQVDYYIDRLTTSTPEELIEEIRERYP